MIEWDQVVATLVGVVTGAAPFTIRALWRYCEKRSDQRHELAMKQLENQEKMVQRGIDRGYEFGYDQRAGGYYPRLNRLNRGSSSSPRRESESES